MYFWFGLLKVLELSPASPLVTELFGKTIAHMPIIGGMSPALFCVLFGAFEMLIGLLFIIPRMEKVASTLFFLHIITTAFPLILISSVWTHTFVPTLEGQYIIKNLALIACVLNILGSIQKRNSATI